MHITTKQIAKELIKDKTQVNDIIISLQVVKSLVAKYWISIYSSKISQFIFWIDEKTWNIIQFLAKIWKKEIHIIKSLITIIKHEYPDYIKQFTIQSPKGIQDELISKLNPKFDNKETNIIDNSDWIIIKGEWRSYERSINKDIDKLLV